MKVWMRLDIPESQLASVRASFPDVEFLVAGDSDGAAVETADAVFTVDPVPDETVARMPNLRWLHVQHGGAAGYLTPHISGRVAVTTSTGVHGTPFAEFALASLFVLAKRFTDCWELQRERRWDENLAPVLLDGKTLGILGFGVIGNELARKASALGMRVVATKRRPAEPPPYVAQLGTTEFQAEALAQSDFVVLCLPSTERDVLGEAELMGMKQGSFLVNLTARQAIAGEDVLIRALRRRPHRGGRAELLRSRRARVARGLAAVGDAQRRHRAPPRRPGPDALGQGHGNLRRQPDAVQVGRAAPEPGRPRTGVRPDVGAEGFEGVVGSASTRGTGHWSDPSADRVRSLLV